MSGIMTLNRGWPTPPPEAVAVGYKTLLFFDEFASLSTIDLSNTKATGFNWYVAQFLGQTGPGAGDVSLAAGQGPTELILTGANGPPDYPRINSAGYLGNRQYVGTVFAGSTGFYAETMCSFNPALAQGNLTPVPFPSFWMSDINYRMAQTSPFIAGVNGCEIDVIECAPTGVGTSQVRMFDFVLSSTSTGGDSIIATGGGPFPGTATFTNMNRYGALLVPMARNGGNGFLKRYCNSVLQTTINTTWTAGSTFSPMETMHYYLILNGGNVNWPITVEYVAVWGP